MIDKPLPTESVICLHGLGSSSSVFGPLRRCAALNACGFITPDYAGHVNSQHERYEGDPLLFAADKITTSIEREGRGVTLVGHSMGGALALLIAQRRRDLVTALGSIEGNLIGGRISQRISRAANDNEVNEIKAGLIATAAQSGNAGWKSWAKNIAPLSPQVLRDYALSLTNLSASGLLPDLFNQFSGPKAYIYGDRYDKKALAGLDRAFTHHVKGADHFVMQDAPDTCADLIRENLLTTYAPRSGVSPQLRRSR